MDKFTGKVWVLGDDIDTDIIIPTEYLALKTIDDMKQYGFSPLRPELAGQIQKGDIITKFDGKDVTSLEELSSNMQYYAAGTTVDVVIERSSNGQYEEQTISVTLGKKN